MAHGRSGAFCRPVLACRSKWLGRCSWVPAFAGTTSSEIPNVSAYIACPVRKAFRLRAFTPGPLASCALSARPGVAADTFASSENDIEPP